MSRFSLGLKIENVSAFPQEKYFASQKVTVDDLTWKLEVKKTAQNNLAVRVSIRPVSSSAMLPSSVLLSFYVYKMLIFVAVHRGFKTLGLPCENWDLAPLI